MRSLIVTGVPRAGKSTLARRVAEARGMDYFPLDAMVSVLGSEHPDLGITHRTDDMPAVSRRLAPLVAALTRHLEYEDCPTVLDVYQCLPGDLATALQERLIPVPEVVCVGYPAADPRRKLGEIRRHARPGDWTEELSDAVLEGLVQRFIRESRRMAREAEELGWQYIDLSSNFQDTLADYITALGYSKERDLE